jgi:prolyl-tRNA editing enzyme YbaK/EbsC (Cys-tRNA(Pro) deacylase)
MSLIAKQMDYQLIEHRRTESARDEPDAIGVPPEEVAKTIMLVTDARYVCAVIPASEHIDPHKVRELLADSTCDSPVKPNSFSLARCTNSVQFHHSASLQVIGCALRPTARAARLCGARGRLP